MAVFYADGFDHYGTGATGYTNMLKGNWASSGSDGPQGTTKRTGAYAIKAQDTLGSVIRIAFPEPKDVLGAAFAYRVDTLPSSEGAGVAYFARISNTLNSTMCRLALATTGAIRLYNSAGTLIDSSAAGVIAANSWNHIEVRYEFANGDGKCEVRVNEVTVLDLEDINIGAPASAEQISFGDAAGIDGFGNWYLDDLVLWDDQGGVNDDFLGDVSVFCHMPNADTAQADWTKSTGSVGYVIIDDIPYDSDYLQAANVNDRSDFEMPTFSVGNVAAVKAVMRFSLVKKSSAGTATFQQGVVSNSTDGDGAIHSPGTTEQYFNDVFDKDPDGSVAWDVAAVEDMQIYIEKVS